MQKLKNVLFYSWWINFWSIILLVTAIVNWRVCVRILPLVFVAFVGYAFYTMLVTRPPLPSEPPKESPTPEQETDDGKIKLN